MNKTDSYDMTDSHDITDSYDITEILLKATLNILTVTSHTQ